MRAQTDCRTAGIGDFTSMNIRRGDAGGEFTSAIIVK